MKQIKVNFFIGRCFFKKVEDRLKDLGQNFINCIEKLMIYFGEVFYLIFFLKQYLCNKLKFLCSFELQEENIFFIYLVFEEQRYSLFLLIMFIYIELVLEVF